MQSYTLFICGPTTISRELKCDIWVWALIMRKTNLPHFATVHIFRFWGMYRTVPFEQKTKITHVGFMWKYNHALCLHAYVKTQSTHLCFYAAQRWPAESWDEKFGYSVLPYGRQTYPTSPRFTILDCAECIVRSPPSKNKNKLYFDFCENIIIHVVFMRM